MKISWRKRYLAGSGGEEEMAMAADGRRKLTAENESEKRKLKLAAQKAISAKDNV